MVRLSNLLTACKPKLSVLPTFVKTLYVLLLYVLCLFRLYLPITHNTLRSLVTQPTHFVRLKSGIKCSKWRNAAVSHLSLLCIYVNCSCGRMLCNIFNVNAHLFSYVYIQYLLLLF